LGITGVASITANVQATAPHAAASFRGPLQSSDITVAPAAGSAVSNFATTPKTNGDADFSVDVTISSPNLCQDGLLAGLVCGVLSGLLATNQTVTVGFPALAGPVLAGSKLSAGAKNGYAGPFDFLNPASGHPHYWFMQNQWYRYTYYAIAPSASAAGPGGGDMTINGFPAANGSTNDKKFVLALMGPAVTGQARSATAAVNQYLEGQNATIGGPPRTFAHQVFAISGNDRLAACPFSINAASICD
jgi:hypothetical protein